MKAMVGGRSERDLRKTTAGRARSTRLQVVAAGEVAADENATISSYTTSALNGRRKDEGELLILDGRARAGQA